MRRALVGTAFIAIALLVIAEPAYAAPAAASAAPAGLGSPTVTTDKGAVALWVADPVSTKGGFKQQVWQLQFDVSSPGVSVLNASSCVDFYDRSMTFTKETCTAGEIESGITFTLDAAHLTHASVGASGIPAQTCSTDANFQLIGHCKPAAPISVKAIWTGSGPITYSTFTQYTPGVYRLIQRSRSRGADASAAFNHEAPLGQLGFADLQASTTKEWGSPCGAAGARGGLAPDGLASVHPDGC